MVIRWLSVLLAAAAVGRIIDSIVDGQCWWVYCGLPHCGQTFDTVHIVRLIVDGQADETV